MTTHDRPPTDSAEFFESWLPAQYQQVAGELKRTPPDAIICVELSGEGGGAWTLALSGGTLTVTPAASDSANITLRQSVEDWRVVTLGAQGAQVPSLTSLGASIDKLLTSPVLGQLLTGVSGTLRFVIAGFQGRDFATEISFQGAAEPHATITVDADTLDQIRSGALAPAQAFFANKIRISGDAAFAMQVGMTAMTPSP
jgi:putative sterol carrier protein